MTAPTPVQQLEQRRTRDYERYEDYRLFEEKTDISERLSLPIETRVQFELRGTQVYGYGPKGPVRMIDVAQQSYAVALSHPGFDGANSVERSRRKIELDEASAIEDMVHRGQDGSTMIVVSPIPDAVMQGMTSLNGYRRDLARTMIRIYRFENSSLSSITLSLEQSDKVALERVGHELDIVMPLDMQSENILASRHTFLSSKEEFENLPIRIRFAYDQSLYERTGKVFYAGNRFASKQDAMSFIDQQTDLLSQHTQAITEIMAKVLNPELRTEALEALRRQTAAAIDERLHGGVVRHIRDSVVNDRLVSGDYGGECPTGSRGSSTQESMGLAMGRVERFVSRECPECKTKNVMTTISGDVISGDCGCAKEICTGRVLRRGPGQQAQGSPKSEKAKNPTPQTYKKSAHEMTVSHSSEAKRLRIGNEILRQKNVKRVGGTALVWVNLKGQIDHKITQLVQRSATNSAK